jgi:hypothetical protein
MTMEYHDHTAPDGHVYTHRHPDDDDLEHEHDKVFEGTIVSVGMAQETNVGRREVKSG